MFATVRTLIECTKVWQQKGRGKEYQWVGEEEGMGGTYVHIFLPRVEFGAFVHVNAAGVATDGHGQHHSDLESARRRYTSISM